MSVTHDVTQYYKVKIGEVHANVPVPCDIFLYLKLNKRIVLIRKKGDAFEFERLNKFKFAKQDHFFIKNEDVEVFRNYDWEANKLNIVKGTGEEKEEADVISGDIQEDKTSQTVSGDEEKDTSLNTVSGNEDEDKPKRRIGDSFVLHDKDDAVFIPSKQAKDIFDKMVVRQGDMPEDEVTVVRQNALDTIKEILQIKNLPADQGEAGSVIQQNLAKMVAEIIDVTKSNSARKALKNLRTHEDKLDQHCIYVGQISAILAKALGLDTDEILGTLALAGILHDTGLKEIPKEVLAKDPEKLSSEEKETYQDHVRRSIELLANIDTEPNDLVKTIIMQHHENFDGTGFPTGAVGEEIHELTRILAIANELDRFITKSSDIKNPIVALDKLRQENKTRAKCSLDPILLSKIINSLKPIRSLMEKFKRPEAQA